MRVLQTRRLPGFLCSVRMCLWVVCFSLVICLGGCVTVYESDEDESQGRGGVDVSPFDVMDSAMGRQR